MQAQQASLLVYHMRLLPIVLVALSAQRATACTAVVAGRKATANGATLLLHTDDCLDCDFRLARVPPLSASAVAQPEPVRLFSQLYPREVSNRSPTYDPSNLDTDLPKPLLDVWTSDEWYNNQTIGELAPLEPEVAAMLGVVAEGTLATIEGLYSIANSKQVAMVESTCGATPALLSLARTNPSQGARDGALWDISALSRVALSRCPSARCAVDLMGYLATRDGFYGGHGTGLPEVAANGELLLVSAECARVPLLCC